MAKNAMARGRSSVTTGGGDEFAAAQISQCALNRALGQAGRVREGAKTHSERFPFIAHSLTVEMEKNQIRGRFLIVADQIAHEHVEDIIVDRNDLLKAGISK